MISISEANRLSIQHQPLPSVPHVWFSMRRLISMSCTLRLTIIGDGAGPGIASACPECPPVIRQHPLSLADALWSERGLRSFWLKGYLSLWLYIDRVCCGRTPFWNWRPIPPMAKFACHPMLLQRMMGMFSGCLITPCGLLCQINVPSKHYGQAKKNLRNSRIAAGLDFFPQN